MAAPIPLIEIKRAAPPPGANRHELLQAAASRVDASIRAHARVDGLARVPEDGEEPESIWLSRGRGAGSFGPGFGRIVAFLLSTICVVPLYVGIGMGHAIVYAQSRDDACHELNQIGLMHVATWPCTIALITVSIYLWGVTFENAVSRLSKYCYPFRYSQYYLSTPAIVTAAWLLALGVMSSVALGGLTDPVFCGSSSLFKITIGSIFAEFILALKLLSSAWMYITYPKSDPPQQRPDQIDNDLLAESRLPLTINVLAVGMAGAGQRTFLLNIIRLLSSGRLAGYHTSRDTLQREEQRIAWDLRWGVWIAARTGNNPDIIRLSDDKRIGWSHIDQRPELYDFHHLTRAQQNERLKAMATAPSLPAPDQPQQSSACSPDSIKIDIITPTSAARSGWRLGVDPMTIVFRMAGPATTARAASLVCRVWRQYANWQRLVPLWWLDATGERMHHTAAPTAAVTATATAAVDAKSQPVSSPQAVNGLEPAQIMRVLTSFDHRTRTIRDTLAYTECGPKYVSPVRFVCWDHQPHLKYSKSSAIEPIHVLISCMNLLEFFDRVKDLTFLYHPYGRSVSRRAPHIVWLTHRAEFVQRMDDAVHTEWGTRFHARFGTELKSPELKRTSEHAIDYLTSALRAMRSADDAPAIIWFSDGAMATGAGGGGGGGGIADSQVVSLSEDEAKWNQTRAAPSRARMPYFALETAADMSFDARAAAIARYAQLLAAENGGGRDIGTTYY